MIAMHCAQAHLTEHKVKQLQNQIFDHTEKQQILEIYNQQRQKITIDLNSVQCE